MHGGQDLYANLMAKDWTDSSLIAERKRRGTKLESSILRWV